VLGPRVDGFASCFVGLDLRLQRRLLSRRLLKFMSQKNDEIILKNVENWKRDRANAAARKVERKRIKKARTERVAFNRGFGSIGDLLSR